MIKPSVDKMLPFIGATLLELAAGMQEKLAVFQEAGYNDELAAKEVLTIAAAIAGVSTAVSSLLNMSVADFSSLSKQTFVHILNEYESLQEGNQVTDIDRRHHNH